jgi:predicted nucleotidyltransferase
MNRHITDTLTKYFSSQPIEKAWIFGSFSRSEEVQGSDIDILVRFDPKVQITLLKYIHMINEIQRLTGKKNDLVEEGQLKGFAIQSAQADKVLIYERKAKR